MNDRNPKHDCITELREVSLKATPARLGVLKLLETTSKPLDVAAMIVYLEKNKIEVDQATVFRIINMFTEKGIAKQISFNEGKFRYELASKADHHHFVCDNCGGVEDVSDCHIDELEKEIKQKKGLLIKRHSLEFFGLCKSCQL